MKERGLETLPHICQETVNMTRCPSGRCNRTVCNAFLLLLMSAMAAIPLARQVENSFPTARATPWQPSPVRCVKTTCIVLRGGNSLEPTEPLRGANKTRPSSAPVTSQAAVDKYWVGVTSGGKRQFAAMAQRLDAWLRREKGLPLKEARRPLILEALRACQLSLAPAQSSYTAEDASTGGSSLSAASGLESGDVDGDEQCGGEEQKEAGGTEEWRLNERLWLACQLGDEDVVSSAIADGALVNSVDETGWGALHFAASENRNAVIQTLLMHKGANASVADAWGMTPLMIAAGKGFTLAVEQLLILGQCDVQAREASQGSTALHFAAANNHADTAAVLFLHGADIAAADVRGRTPEECARLRGYVATAKRIAVLQHCDEEARAAQREVQRADLSDSERAIARAAGFPVGLPPTPCRLRSEGSAGIQLLLRLNPSKYHLGLPGFPRLNGRVHRAFTDSSARFDPFVCLPDNTVTKGRFSFVPDPPGNTTTGGPNGPLWSYNVSPEMELEARALFKQHVLVED